MSHPKTIKEFNNYTIDESGNVYHLSGRKIGTRVTPKGYVQTWLTQNSKTKYRFIHRLVADTFIVKDSENLEVNHKDGNKLNNHVSNLEWVTRHENIRHGFNNGLYKSTENSPNSKLTNKDVAIIRQMIKDGKSLNSIGKIYGVNHATIRHIKLGLTWKRLEQV